MPNCNLGGTCHIHVSKSDISIDARARAHIDKLDRTYCEFVVKSRSICHPMFQKEEAIIGLPAEVGELVSLYQKSYRKGLKPIDSDELLQELGDVFYYFIAILKMEGFTLKQVMNNNIHKICDRNPDRKDLLKYYTLFEEEKGKND